jgi:hypothetical protein
VFEPSADLDLEVEATLFGLNFLSNFASSALSRFLSAGVSAVSISQERLFI